MSTKQKILIVDDDHDYLEQQDLLLTQAGFEVRTCDNPQQAMQLASEWQPEIALLDLMMEHDDDGFVLSYNIKRSHPEITVLIVTSVASETGLEFSAATREERSWIKADAMLAKPVRVEQLRRELQRLKAEGHYGSNAESTGS
jgi:CheY-like chemotaxis protein